MQNSALSNKTSMVNYFSNTCHMSHPVDKKQSSPQRLSPEASCLQNFFTLVGLNRFSEVCSSINSFSTELFFNAQELVVFSKTLRPAWSSSLDLTRCQTHRKVSNESVLSLTTAVASHHTPSCLLGHLHSFNTLCHRPNLVNLEQKCIAGFFIDSL
uniref:Uncharacterized protein n=1 Tax=Opuntia streptacantha TaxID=393608 RepID=A0A7C8ZAU4_OPUST